MKNIKFEVDNKERKITFFIRNGDMYRLVEELHKQGVNTKTMSRNITALLAVVTRKLAEATKLDLQNYEPNLVFYKKLYELPLPLRRRR